MSARDIGPQKDCVQCGISKAEIRAKRYFCATVDYWGETETEWDRHKFTWTQRDADALEAESRYWASVADRFTKEGKS